MKNLVLDTSIFIEQIRTGKGLLSDLALNQRDDFMFFVPTVVVYELHCGQSMSNQKVRNTVEALYTPFQIVELSLVIAQKAGQLTRKVGIRSNDALIAATALEFDAQLATLNIKHFKDVPGLKIWTNES